MVTSWDIEEVKGFIYLTFDSKITEDIRNYGPHWSVAIQSPYGTPEFINEYGIPRYGSLIKPIPIRTRSLNKIALANDFEKALNEAMLRKSDGSINATPLDAAYFYAFAAEWCVLMHPKNNACGQKACQISKLCQNQIRQALSDIVEAWACETKQDLLDAVQIEVIMPLFFNGTFKERECSVNISDTIEDAISYAIGEANEYNDELGSEISNPTDDEFLFNLGMDQKFSNTSRI